MTPQQSISRLLIFDCFRPREVPVCSGAPSEAGVLAHHTALGCPYHTQTTEGQRTEPSQLAGDYPPLGAAHVEAQLVSRSEAARAGGKEPEHEDCVWLLGGGDHCGSAPSLVMLSDSTYNPGTSATQPFTSGFMSLGYNTQYAIYSLDASSAAADTDVVMDVSSATSARNTDCRPILGCSRKQYHEVGQAAAQDHDPLWLPPLPHCSANIRAGCTQASVAVSTVDSAAKIQQPGHQSGADDCQPFLAGFRRAAHASLSMPGPSRHDSTVQARFQTPASQTRCRDFMPSALVSVEAKTSTDEPSLASNTFPHSHCELDVPTSGALQANGGTCSINTLAYSSWSQPTSSDTPATAPMFGSAVNLCAPRPRAPASFKRRSAPLYDQASSPPCFPVGMFGMEGFYKLFYKLPAGVPPSSSSEHQPAIKAEMRSSMQPPQTQSLARRSPAPCTGHHSARSSFNFANAAGDHLGVARKNTTGSFGPARPSYTGGGQWSEAQTSHYHSGFCTVESLSQSCRPKSPQGSSEGTTLQAQLLSQQGCGVGRAPTLGTVLQHQQQQQRQNAARAASPQCVFSGSATYAHDTFMGSAPRCSLNGDVAGHSVSSVLSSAPLLLTTTTARLVPEGSTVMLHVLPALPQGMQRQVWRVSDYKVEVCLQTGTFSSVYRALCRHSNVRVALKVFQLSQVPGNMLHMLTREIQIHSRVRHANIITLYAAFQEAKQVVLVQEFAEGGDLAKQLQPTGLPEGVVVQRVVLPLLRALAYLHSCGLCHRDIKPENLLFTADGTLKLADFGLSIDLLAERAVTRSGTEQYMAPEVASCPMKAQPQQNKDRSDLAYSTASDIYSLGVITHEMLTGYLLPAAPPLAQACGASSSSSSSSALSSPSPAALVCQLQRSGPDEAAACRWIQQALPQPQQQQPGQLQGWQAAQCHGESDALGFEADDDAAVASLMHQLPPQGRLSQDAFAFLAAALEERACDRPTALQLSTHGWLLRCGSALHAPVVASHTSAGMQDGLPFKRVRTML